MLQWESAEPLRRVQFSSSDRTAGLIRTIGDVPMFPVKIDRVM